MAFVKKSNKNSVKATDSVKTVDSAKTTDSLKKQNEITAEVIKLTKEAVSKLTADMSGISDRVEKLEQNDLISKLGDYDKRLNVVEELVKELSDRLTELSDRLTEVSNKLDSALEDEDEEDDSYEESEDDSDEDDSDGEGEDDSEDDGDGDGDSDEDEEEDEDDDEDEDSEQDDDDDEEIEIDPDAVLAIYNGMSKPEQLKLITKVKSELGLKGRVLPKIEALVKEDDSLITVATVMVDDFGIEAEELAAEE